MPPRPPERPGGAARKELASMHDQATSASLSVSRSGVLFVSGFATALRVERGHLVVRTGQGRSISEGRFSRVSKPRIRRVVIYGKGGFTTWGALEWIDGIGAAFVQLARDGRVITASGDAGPNQPALRRAQVAAGETKTGLEIVRSLLDEKLRGQLSVLNDRLPERSNAASAVAAALDQLGAVETIKDALHLEAKAASAYWSGWRDVEIRFARSDQRHVRSHWRVFGERQSPLSTSARNAARPSGAILNYLYALAESEARLALLAVGLDPGLGWAHKDAPYRDSAALDILEPIRPQIDAYVVEMIRERTFSRREFIELPTGQVRLGTSFARSLATSTLPQWESAAAPLAEQVARQVASSASMSVRIPGQRTRGSLGQGRSTLGRRAAPNQTRSRRIPSACRSCGVVLTKEGRRYCPDCLPQFERDRTDKLAAAGRSVLVEMRGRANDPAKSPEAKAKRTATMARRKAAATAWERKNPGVFDREVFLAEILPGLAQATLPEMMAATGLTSGYCWKIKRGERVPHPMYWEKLRFVGTR